MNTHGASDLAPSRAAMQKKLEPGRFHDPSIERMAQVAYDLQAEMYSGGWVQLLNWSAPEQGSAVVAKNTYTTIADIVNAQRAFIPAGSLNVGTLLRTKVWGTLGSAAGTATATLAAYLNGAASGVALATSAAATPATSTVNVWMAEFLSTVLTIGSAGTIQTVGQAVGLGATATTPIIIPATLPAASALNTTQANSITVAVGWPNPACRSIAVIACGVYL